MIEIREVKTKRDLHKFVTFPIELYKDKTNDELYEMLIKVDPESCKTIHKNNRRRNI